MNVERFAVEAAAGPAARRAARADAGRRLGVGHGQRDRRRRARARRAGAARVRRALRRRHRPAAGRAAELDAALAQLDPDVRARPGGRDRQRARGRRGAGWATTTTVELPEGQRSRARAARAPRRDLRAGRAQPVPVDGRDGRRHRARGGRRGGRRLRARRPPGDPRAPARCAAPTRSGAWAARTRSPRLPTAPTASRASTSSPARARSTCRRPSARSPATSASTASPGRRDVLVLAAGDADPELVAADLLAQAEHGDGTIVALRHRRRAAARRGRRAPGCRARRRRGRRASSLVADLDEGLAVAEAFAPEHLELVGADAEALAGRVRSAGCVFVGATAARRSATTSPARTTRCPPAAPRASPPRCRRASFRRRMTVVRIGAAADALARAGAPIARGRGLRPSTRRRWRCARIRRDDPHRRDRTPDQGDRRPPDARARRRRRGHARDRVSASSTTCSTCSRATGAWTSRSTSPATCETGAHHTVEDTGIVLGQALDQALGDRAGIYRYGHAVVPMDEARAQRARSTSPAARSWPSRPTCRPAATGNFDHELTEEFFRAVANAAKMTLHLDGRGRHQRPPHDRGGVQGVRPRAARRRRDRPDRDRRALDEGHARRRDGRSASSTTGWATAAPSRRRWSASARRVVLTGDHDALRAADGLVVPGVGAFPRGDGGARRAGLDELIRERAERRRAGARPLPGHAAALRGAPRSSAAPRRASGCCPARSCASTRAA